MYWRRKEGKIIAEGKIGNKTLYLFQLPSIEKVLNASFFSTEKREKIKEKIKRLDFKEPKSKNHTKKVRTRKIIRNNEKDAFDPDIFIGELKGGDDF